VVVSYTVVPAERRALVTRAFEQEPQGDAVKRRGRAVGEIVAVGRWPVSLRTVTTTRQRAVAMSAGPLTA
jgi:hypothetical protein